MSDSTKKQTFLHGAALLALATAVVKVIGALYKLPLNEVIGKAGYSYFMTAYDIYAVLLMISTVGLPVAMSRMISQASALGNYRQVKQIYKVSRAIFLGLGLASSVLMVVGCRWLANMMNQPDATASILVLGPSAFLMGVISTYRGFFQGQGDMRPTSNSQMLEAVFKLVIGLAAAFLIMKTTQRVDLAAGGAILGVTVSCLISTFYLRSRLVPAYRDLPQDAGAALSAKQTAKDLLAIAIPITIGAAGLQLLTVFENGLYMDRLVYLIGSNQYMSHMVTGGVDVQEAASTLKGIYNMAQTIFNMPCAFIVPITVSVIPAISERLTLCQDAEVRQTEESAARVTGLLSLPCSVGLILLASPIMSLLGNCQGEQLVLGSTMMALLGASVFLYAIIQYTNALLQSHGYAHVPVIHMLLCGVARLAVVYVLSGNPNLGILGVPMGSLGCYLCIALLNLLAIRRLVPQKPRLLRNLARSLPAAAIMGGAVYGCYFAMTNFLPLSAESRLHSILLCAAPILVGVVVYFVSVVLTKAITREDCLLLPKGDKIADLLHL